MVKDKWLEIQYDCFNKNRNVTSKKEINEILSKIGKTKFSDLDERYLSYSKSNEKKYRKLVKQLEYYKVKRKDLNKKIVGKYRLKEFLCKDDYYKGCLFNRVEEIPCIINRKLLYKTLDLLEVLEKRGYNQYGFKIVNGHRHPKYNEKVGGAKLSRHIKGEAVDIEIDDINNDGVSNKIDKDIVLEILENEIIKNEGGIGLYPGTGNVHYDVRGTRARWNSY